MPPKPIDRGEGPGAGAPAVAELLDALGIGVFRIAAASGEVLWGSDAFARLMGYEGREAIVGVSALDHYTDPKERKEALTRFFGRPGEQGRPPVLRVESKRTRHDTGASVDVRMNIAPRYDENGALTVLDGTMEGIGAPAAAIQKAFKQSEERFRVVFEEAAIGLIITDTSGVISRVNRCFCQLCGAAEDDLLGRDVHELLLDSATRQRIVDLSAAAGERSAGAEEVCFTSATKDRVHAYVNRCWLRDDAGNAHSAVLMVQDITARKRAEEALLRLDKLEALALLAGGIAHDFNNVLTGIVGNISLARASLSHDGREATRYLAAAEKSTLQAKSLTAQLLTFARGGAPAPRPTALARLVDEAALFCLRGSNVSYAVEAPPRPWAALCDVGQTAQVLHNLLINAKQAMAEGGKVEIALANVTVDATTDLPLSPGRYCQITVQDSGPGIAPEDLPRIFDPYFSTKREGSGLGLATAHSIVRRHGGCIHGSAAAGRGARFDVYLPAANVDAPAPTPSSALPDRLGGRVLILDDEAAIRDAVADSLTLVGVEVSSASDSDQALALFSTALERGRAFDCVILDLTIPGGIGGLEVLPQLKALDANVKAIVSSGYAANDVMANHEAHGFIAALPKPYSLEELKRAVAPYLPHAS